MTVFQNPYTTLTDEAKLAPLQALKGGQTYKQLLTQPDGTIKLGRLELDAADLGDVLDQTFEPKGLDTILNVQARLAKMSEANDKRIANLNKSVETKARKLLAGSPTTKSELALAELREKVAELNVFNNPLAKASEVVKLRQADGDVYQVRLYGSAVTKILPGEDAQAATQRLADMIINDEKALVGLMNLKPTAGNLAAVRHARFTFKGELPEGQVGLLSAYSVSYNDVAKLIRSVDRLMKLPNVVHVLDASRADSATLRLNLTQDEELAELESDLDADTETLDLADAI